MTMQAYNTQQPDIILPEYGRNIQALVNYCKTIPDRKRRNACARAIVGIMGDLYPDLAQVSGRKNILWDHLSVIAGHELDIDYPCEVMKPEELASKPEPLPNMQSNVRIRMYGKRMEALVAHALTIEDAQERMQLFELIANQMKRNFHNTYKDASEENRKILQDLLFYAGDAYRDEIMNIRLLDVKALSINNQYDPASLIVTPSKKKKKKK